MFVPGVNGSVIPSVSSGSKLKSAYKNSKSLSKRKMSKGGEIEDEEEEEENDDKEMVDGVASILRGVKDKKNRLQLANKLAKQFDREKVKYSLPKFLKKSKVKK